VKRPPHITALYLHTQISKGNELKDETGLFFVNTAMRNHLAGWVPMQPLKYLRGAVPLARGGILGSRCRLERSPNGFGYLTGIVTRNHII